MTNQQHPITPPDELVRQWTKAASYKKGMPYPEGYEQCEQRLCTAAAQWGADQQLAEDVKWLDQYSLDAPHLKITLVGKSLIEAMRPKPPTLNSIALQMLGTIERDAHYIPEITDTIRRALEQLPN